MHWKMTSLGPGRSFETAADLLPASSSSSEVLARKACLETRAGRSDLARQLIEQAHQELEEPTPLWLLMAIEARRYRLPRKEIWLYEERWSDSLRRRCRGDTAGAMAKLVRAYLEEGSRDAPARDYVTQLLGYLKRCSRLRWQSEELREVCALLLELDEDDVLRKLTRKATKRFPEIAFFHSLEARLELLRGPFAYNQAKAEASLRAAMELASSSGDPRDQEILSSTQRTLTALLELNMIAAPPKDRSDDEGQHVEEQDEDDTKFGDVDTDNLGGMNADLLDGLGSFFAELQEADDDGPPDAPRRGRSRRRKNRRGKKR